MAKLPLEPGEQVLLKIRKHWLVYTANATSLFVLLILPYVGFRLLGIETVNVTEKMRHLFILLYVGWFLLLWTYFFITWTNTFLDAWIVTDRRIIDIEQISMFHRDVTDFRHERIQDITIEERGLLGNLFGFGNVHVQTAGEERALRIDTVPQPYKIREIIAHCHDEALSRSQSSTQSDGH